MSTAKTPAWYPTAYLRTHVTPAGGRLRQWWVCTDGRKEWRTLEDIQVGAPGWDAPPGQMPVIDGISNASVAAVAPAVDKKPEG